MHPANVSALRDSEPPHANHVVIISALVPALIKRTCHVTMAIVAAQVVHHAFVNPIGFDYARVMPLRILSVQSHVLVCLPESQIVHGDSIRAREVMDDTVAHSDACVTNEGKDPGYQRQWGPHYAVRESCLRGVDLNG